MAAKQTQGQRITDADRLKHLGALRNRMARAGEKLPTVEARRQASANADVVQWAVEQLTALLPPEETEL